MVETVELTDGVLQSTLPSGVRVVTEAMPDVRSVAVGYWLGVGSRDEHEPVAGASHFLEHLLFKGTPRRSAQEIAEALDAVGGDLNAFTGKEYTCFYARCLDRDLPLAVDVLGDMITSARIRVEDVDAEREVVLEEIRMHLDAPDDLVHSVANEALFGPHPLAHEVLGSADSIREMSRDAVHGYFRRHYVPENLAVVIAGNLDHSEAVREVAASLEGLAPPAGQTIERAAPLEAPRHVPLLRPRPTEQAHVVLGSRGLRRSDPRRFAARVLDQALGGGMASRLFQEIRERRGLAYSVYSYQSMHVDSGVFGVYAGSAPNKVRTVLEVLRSELDRARRDGLTGAELERAKGFLAGSMVLSLEDTGSRMGRLGKSMVTGTPLLTLDETIAAVEAVTHDDVREVAEELLTGPFVLAGVGPFAEDEASDYLDYCAA